MKVDNISAWQVEEGDQILFAEDIVTVKEKSDNEQIALTLCDDDGMCQTFYFDANDGFTLYLGEDDVEFEDVEADPE